MAIERPTRGGGPGKDKGTSKSKIEKRSWQEFQKALTGPGPKLLPANTPLTPPKNFESENEWIQYLSGVSIKQVSDYLESKSLDDIDVTQALVLKTLATKILKLLQKTPDGFNEWLEYFSGMTPAQTENFLEAHANTMDNEAEAAGKRWLQIRDNPALIDKIVNSRLQSSKQEEIGDIMEAAKSGDDLLLYQALRNNIAWKIQDGAGARDTTPLIKQLNEVTAHLNVIYRERGIKDDKQDSNIRKMLINARHRNRRVKQQAVRTISDMEDDDMELESL